MRPIITVQLKYVYRVVIACPTCGREFENRRGLGVHHSQTHGEKLPNRECDHCGEEFHCKHERVYCSQECLSEATSNEGSNNPNYQGGKTSTTCEACDDSFSYYPSEKDGVYCSLCVKTENWRPQPNIERSQNPRWKGGRQSYHCAMCGDEVRRYPSEVTSDVVLCGTDCQSDWLSEAFEGEGHPNWKGGSSSDYGKGWAEIRRRALERDGHACVMCQKSKGELGRNPDVHHIVPVREFRESNQHQLEDAHSLHNVATLCISCHRRADFGKISRSQLRYAIGVVGR